MNIHASNPAMASGFIRTFILFGLLFMALVNPSRAQNFEYVSDGQNQILGDADLDLLFGPIALYPDPLLAILLPAATQPSEIVQAVRYLDSGGPTDQIDAQPLSDSVKALARYPEVIRWMDENLDWTTDVGEAFQLQPEDVMNTIQRLRRLAQYLGHLIPTPEQIVETDEGLVEILPADSTGVFVPYYQPEYVFTRAAAASVGPLVRFGRSTPVASWFKYDWDWRSRRVVVWNKDSFRPQNWWRQPHAKRFGKEAKFQEWCPRPRPNQAKFWKTRQQSNSRPAMSRGGSPSVSAAAAAGGSAGRLGK